ncbi:13336_t:CDS:2 [Acaulospora morrowiae]|uniref:13336_t:CDS:1 n=1 Tax=Acaulospora morrowiae TaxID=94023 RepID=A0A9N8WAM9_9GLOM|nr:13336_t:CDS:2 [Acaulospora morrowiae]
MRPMIELIWINFVVRVYLYTKSRINLSCIKFWICYRILRGVFLLLDEEIIEFRKHDHKLDNQQIHDNIKALLSHPQKFVVPFDKDSDEKNNDHGEKVVITLSPPDMISSNSITSTSSTLESFERDLIRIQRVSRAQILSLQGLLSRITLQLSQNHKVEKKIDKGNDLSSLPPKEIPTELLGVKSTFQQNLDEKKTKLFSFGNPLNIPSNHQTFRPKKVTILNDTNTQEDSKDCISNIQDGGNNDSISRPKIIRVTWDESKNSVFTFQSQNPSKTENNARPINSVQESNRQQKENFSIKGGNHDVTFRLKEISSVQSDKYHDSIFRSKRDSVIQDGSNNLTFQNKAVYGVKIDSNNNRTTRCEKVANNHGHTFQSKEFSNVGYNNSSSSFRTNKMSSIQDDNDRKSIFRFKKVPSVQGDNDSAILSKKYSNMRGNNNHVPAVHFKKVSNVRMNHSNSTLRDYNELIFRLKTIAQTENLKRKNYSGIEKPNEIRMMEDRKDRLLKNKPSDLSSTMFTEDHSLRQYYKNKCKDLSKSYSNLVEEVTKKWRTEFDMILWPKLEAGRKKAEEDCQKSISNYDEIHHMKWRAAFRRKGVYESINFNECLLLPLFGAITDRWFESFVLFQMELIKYFNAQYRILLDTFHDQIKDKFENSFPEKHQFFKNIQSAADVYFKKESSREILDKILNKGNLFRFKMECGIQKAMDPAYTEMDSHMKWCELKSLFSRYIYKNRRKIFDSAMNEAKNVEQEFFKDFIKPVIRRGVRLLAVVVLGEHDFIREVDKVKVAAYVKTDKTKFAQLCENLRTLEVDDEICDKVLKLWSQVDD